MQLVTGILIGGMNIINKLVLTCEKLEKMRDTEIEKREVRKIHPLHEIIHLPNLVKEYQ